MARVENRTLNKARAGYHRNHVFVTGATYKLPISKGRHWMNSNKFLDFVFEAMNWLDPELHER